MTPEKTKAERVGEFIGRWIARGITIGSYLAISYVVAHFVHKYW